MPQEVIYYLIAAFILWVIIFAIDYWCSETMTLADLLIDGVMAVFWPITLVIIVFCLLCDADKIVIKKRKTKKCDIK